MGVLGLPILLASYLATAVAVAACILRLGFPARNGGAAMLYAVPLAPALQAWLLYALLKINATSHWWLIVACVQTFSMLPLILWPGQGRRVLSETAAGLRTLAASAWEGARRHQALALVGLGASVQTLLLIYDIFTAPVIASDPLEYFAVARVIHADASLARYPIDPSLADSGLYARSAHPPSYHLMLAWTFVFHGDPASSLLARLPQAIYALSLMALCAHVAARMVDDARRGVALFLAPVFVLSIGLFGSQASALHIDVMRITMYLLAFCAFAELAERMAARRGEPLSLADDLAPALVTGGLAGFGMFAHSIGILILPCLGLCYFLIVRRSPVAFLAIGTAIVVGALLVGSWQFVSNVLQYGVPVHDSEPIWELPSINDARDVRYRRDLVTLDQRFWRGLLVWFSNTTLLGYIHWLALLPGVFFLRGFLSRTYGKVMVIGLLAFYFVAVTTMLIGVDLVIKNFRYMMTLLPFLVVIAAAACGSTYAILRKKLLG